MDIKIYKGRLDISVKSVWMGRDILILVKGGDAHIGALALANRGEIISAGETPHHRELELAKYLSIFFSKKLDCAACVCMGIHYDAITRAEIGEIRDIVQSGIPFFSDILNYAWPCDDTA